MSQLSYKDVVENKEGYVLLPAFIPHKLISDFKNVLPKLYPVRATDKNKKYAERHEIKNLQEISVWWSQFVLDFSEFKAIEKLISTVIKTNFPNMVLYSADTVCINAQTNLVNPHVDTPHRFKKFNYDPRLLSIQCIITLDDVSAESGSTGLVPFSQKRDFNIDDCYKGMYDRWFKENAKQNYMSRGSVLFYNCRILHSSMPNHSDKPRTVLLINYMDKSIIEEVKDLDNIWASNESA